MRAPSPRRLTSLGLAGWGAAIVVTATLLSLKVISPTVAAIVIFNGAVLAAIVALLGLVEQRVGGLAESLADHARDHRARTAMLSTSIERLDADVGHARERLSKEIFTVYRQLEAMVDLRALIGARAPLPELRGWALSPDALRLIMREVFARQPQLIVECGSGSSSVWLGYAVQRLGIGRVVALEHDERFLAVTRDLLRAHGLGDVVEVRHAPLTPWDNGTGDQPWYDVRAVTDLDKIGLILVDGPPGTIDPTARYPALPVLLPKCTDDALIVLDDTVRAGESAVSERWLAEHPELRRTVHRFEKGLHAFERTPRA
ncbi:MAG TPA: class I SAM-dependent methyltransferase [Streptosporangiaceae bacterium]|nr:class I SAM-dependent methyltransferase [Streptosporangiaceae bacterium]